MSKDKAMSRRAFTALLGIGGVGLLGTGAGVMTGVLDFSNFPDSVLGINQSQDITSDDTAGDGTEGGRTLDLEGREVVPEEGDEYVSPEQVERMDITPWRPGEQGADREGRSGPSEAFERPRSESSSSGSSSASSGEGRMRISAVGMDVPINLMTTADDIATPPGFRAVYALRDHGTGLYGPDEGRIIVAGHSSTRRFPPGNYLINSRTGNPRVGAGTIIDFSGIRYRITGSEQIEKHAIAKASQVWEDKPGTLVFITCRQVGGPRTTHNTVFYAEKV